MAILQIRDIPEEIYLELTEEAKKQHRSLSQQAIVTLAKGLKVDSEAVTRKDELLRRLRKQKTEKANASLPNIVDLVRKDRDR